MIIVSLLPWNSQEMENYLHILSIKTGMEVDTGQFIQKEPGALLSPYFIVESIDIHFQNQSITLKVPVLFGVCLELKKDFVTLLHGNN